MARRSIEDIQLAFDIDGLIHQAAVAAAPEWQGAPLRFTTDYFTPAELDAAFDHWCFLHGSFNSLALSHMWTRHIGVNKHIAFREHSIDIFNAELRCTTWEHRDAEDGCSCVGHLVVQAICEPCGWHTIADHEDTVVEAWHDHAVPDWRSLPVVPARIRVRNEKGLTPRAREWITDHYPPSAQVPGAPIITQRSQHGTRHVSGYSPWGGYDLSSTAIGEETVAPPAPNTSPRRSRPPAPTSPARTSRSRDRGLGL